MIRKNSIITFAVVILAANIVIDSEASDVYGEWQRIERNRLDSILSTMTQNDGVLDNITETQKRGFRYYLSGDYSRAANCFRRVVDMPGTHTIAGNTSSSELFKTPSYVFLGLMYWYGLGVSQDRSLARQYINTCARLNKVGRMLKDAVDDGEMPATMRVSAIRRLAEECGIILD